MRTFIFSSCALAAALTGACGDDPAAFSQPVGIELKVESDKVLNDTITSDKAINTESGNPYGAFITDAQVNLGRAPSSIEVSSATLEVGASSQGVTALGEIFVGQVQLLFQMNDSNDTAAVATVAIDANTGRGPIAMDSSFDSEDLSDDNYQRLLTGSFKLVITGPTVDTFDTASAKANVQATLTLEAFE